MPLTLTLSLVLLILLIFYTSTPHYRNSKIGRALTPYRGFTGVILGIIMLVIDAINNRDHVLISPATALIVIGLRYAWVDRDKWLHKYK